MGLRGPDLGLGLDNNGSFIVSVIQDLQESIVHWLKVVNLFAYFPFISLNSIQQSLHIWDRASLMPLCKAPPNHKLFIIPFDHSVSLVLSWKHGLKLFNLKTFFGKA